jgi:hypothetical protein
MARRDRELAEMAKEMPETGSPRAEDREADHAIRDSVVSGVLGSSMFRQEDWRLVVNGPDRTIFGVAPGLYPDIVALDGSDAGVAWILEIATPASIVEESAWERWGQMAGTGLSFILAVPFGTGHMTEKAADMLDVRAGLIYEYGVTPDCVIFNLPRQNHGIPRL